MNNTCDIIVGLQHGDEGKGKVAHSMLKNNKYDYCIRYNGGPNAGHTIQLTPTKSIILHQLPCGVLHKIPSIIGTNCVIDLFKLEAEINKVEEEIPELEGIKERLYLAHNAHLILEDHIECENKNNTIGTTRCGIGPCYVEKVNRTGLRVVSNEDIISKLNIKVVDINELYRKTRNTHTLFEGAQGFGLDIDWGDYPYVTSSVVNSYGVYSCGIPNLVIKDIIGCAKLYDTYVGEKQFQPEGDTTLKLIASYGKEVGSTTGRDRQTNWLNFNELEKAISINNCNYVVFNKCDVLKQISVDYEKEGISVYKLYIKKELKEFSNLEAMQEYVYYNLKENDVRKEVNMNVLFSHSAEDV